MNDSSSEDRERVKQPEDHMTTRLYEELRRIAHNYMGRHGGLTIQPTELVHEALLKLVGHDGDFNDEVHFRAVAATAMRQILIDHLRGRGAAKRGGGRDRVTLTDLPDQTEALDFETLDRSLVELAKLDERAALVVEMKFLGGLTDAAIASVLKVTDRTVRNDWRMARAWLRKASTVDGDS